MTKYRIVDIIGTQNAIIQDFGLIVYEKVKIHLMNNEEVILSFDEIRNITSGFCNASIGNIYRVFPNTAKYLLKLEDITSSNVNLKINEAIRLSADKEKIENQDSAITELFLS